MEQFVVYRGVWCQVVDHGWRVKDWTSPETGQSELMAWKRYAYIPQGDPDDPDERDSGLFPTRIDQSGTQMEADMLEARRLRNLEKSAARAKRTCRHKIKAAGSGSLLTCTYRENMTDFDRMRSDWAAFMRKVKRAIPGFRAVFAFEPQERGSWHCHAAIDKLPPWLWVPQGERSPVRVKVRSWDYLRRLWRSVVGADNGNIDVDGHLKTRHGLPGKHRASESLAKLAGYVSKYLTKDHATGPEGRNRWGSTQGIDLPRPRMIDLPPMPLHDVIELAFNVPDGHRIVRHHIGQFAKFWMLYTEPGESSIPAQV